MRAVILGILLSGLTATPAFGQELVGEWIATAHSPEGNFSEQLSVRKTDGGYSIEAKLLGPPTGMPEAGPATDILLDGSRFSFKRSVGDSITIVYSGTVSGDEFDGMVEIAGFQMPYRGVRAKGD